MKILAKMITYYHIYPIPQKYSNVSNGKIAQWAGKPAEAVHLSLILVTARAQKDCWE